MAVPSLPPTEGPVPRHPATDPGLPPAPPEARAPSMVPVSWEYETPEPAERLHDPIGEPHPSEGPTGCEEFPTDTVVPAGAVAAPSGRAWPDARARASWRRARALERALSAPRHPGSTGLRLRTLVLAAASGGMLAVGVLLLAIVVSWFGIVAG